MEVGGDHRVPVAGEAGHELAGGGPHPGKERILCLDAATGKVLWKHESEVTYTVSYPGGPRVTSAPRWARRARTAPPVRAAFSIHSFEPVLAGVTRPWDIGFLYRSEESGGARLAWEIARLAMLVSVSAVAAAVFLGGPLGPVLPGPVWLWFKTAAVMALIVLAGTSVTRTTPSRMLGLIWTIVLPLSFLHLGISGALAL